MISKEDKKILEAYVRDFYKRNKYSVAFREDLLKLAIENVLSDIQQLETKQQKVIDRLQHDSEVDNIAVKKLEEKRRTATSEYYKNSYQMQIHKLWC